MVLCVLCFSHGCTIAPAPLCAHLWLCYSVSIISYVTVLLSFMYGSEKGLFCLYNTEQAWRVLESSDVIYYMTVTEENTGAADTELYRIIYRNKCFSVASSVSAKLFFTRLTAGRGQRLNQIYLSPTSLFACGIPQ